MLLPFSLVVWIQNILIKYTCFERTYYMIIGQAKNNIITNKTIILAIPSPLQWMYIHWFHVKCILYQWNLKKRFLFHSNIIIIVLSLFFTNLWYSTWSLNSLRGRHDNGITVDEIKLTHVNTWYWRHMRRNWFSMWLYCVNL